MKMIDFEIITNFDNSLMVWGEVGYTLKKVTDDLKKYCIKEGTDIKNYKITRKL